MLSELIFLQQTCKKFTRRVIDNSRTSSGLSTSKTYESVFEMTSPVLRKYITKVLRLMDREGLERRS